MTLAYAEYMLLLSWSDCTVAGCDCVKAQLPDVYYEALAVLLGERAPA